MTSPREPSKSEKSRLELKANQTEVLMRRILRATLNSLRVDEALDFIEGIEDYRAGKEPNSQKNDNPSYSKGYEHIPKTLQEIRKGLYKK